MLSSVIYFDPNVKLVTLTLIEINAVGSFKLVPLNILYKR